MLLSDLSDHHTLTLNDLEITYDPSSLVKTFLNDLYKPIREDSCTKCF